MVLEFILNICQIDAFISHKVWFFLKSILEKPSVDRQWVEDTIASIEDFSKCSNSMLYIFREKAIINYLLAKKLLFLYSDFIKDTEYSEILSKSDAEISAKMEEITKFQLIKKDYTLRNMPTYEKEAMIDDISKTTQIRADAIIIRPFIASHLNDMYFSDNENIRFEQNSSITLSRIKALFFNSQTSKLFSEHILGITSV